ncbi:MAG TPA: hypothetical protein VFZ43_10780 [Anaerolineales bacterium]
MKAFENERHDWIIIFIILLIGFLCVIIAGQWALRFSPSWKLDADMESTLDPNSDFLTRRPGGFIEPVDPLILTQPVWINVFLTPGASFVTGTPFSTTIGTSFTTSTVTHTPYRTPTPIGKTNTPIVIVSPTNTLIYFSPIPSSTPQPKPSSTFTSAPTYTFTPTATQTSTITFTVTPTPALTNTPDLVEPDFSGPDGNTTLLGNGMSVEFTLSGFILDGDSTWDAVYYEMEDASSSGKIHLGAFQIEAYDEMTAAWYTIYTWGDGIADTNGSYNNGNSEPDGFPVDTSLLYGIPPLNTGIAIDIDTPAIGQGGSIGDLITRIRITSLSNLNCEVDALQMLR